MQLGWALLGGSTQISPLSPEVVGTWKRKETRENMMGGEDRDKREEKTSDQMEQ